MYWHLLSLSGDFPELDFFVYWLYCFQKHLQLPQDIMFIYYCSRFSGAIFHWVSLWEYIKEARPHRRGRHFIQWAMFAKHICIFNLESSVVTIQRQRLLCSFSAVSSHSTRPTTVFVPSTLTREYGSPSCHSFILPFSWSAFGCLQQL